nr:hypothetical protein [Tanacetum cinerariifolium]
EAAHHFHGAAPGAEVLGRQRQAGVLVQVVVDVARLQRVAVAVGAIKLKEVLAGYLLALAHQARQLLVVQRYVVRHTFLAHEGETQVSPVNFNVLVEQRT